VILTSIVKGKQADDQESMKQEMISGMDEHNQKLKS
jgi:hypothetical protein